MLFRFIKAWIYSTQELKKREVKQFLYILFEISLKYFFEIYSIKIH